MKTCFGELYPSPFQRSEIKNMIRIKQKFKKSIIKKLSLLYGKEKSPLIYKELEKIILIYLKRKKQKYDYSANYFNEKDSILIVYGDNIINKKERSLETLSNFLQKNLKKIISTVHIIGLFLYSSDRGFSIIDYKKVNPTIGDPKDLKIIRKNFKLMVDFVCNHMSAKGEWFKKFARGEKKYKDFFIAFNKKPSKKEIKKVFRPRTSKLLVLKKLPIGKKWVWKTFLHDQIDLNYKNPEVLLKMIDVFLFYIENGAMIIRLDAIAYIWKKLGSTCFLTKESHIFVQILREILNIISPSVNILAEVNMLFKENIKYLGDGKNEAQMIYNFSLPLLVLHTFYNENALKILNWLKKIKLPSKDTTLINALDSHDGISVIGANKILSPGEIKMIEEKILKNEGKINFRKQYFNGKKVPYELNITWWSALDNKKEAEDIKIKRYIATRAIALSLKGIPAIYILGFFGIKNCIKSFRKSGKTRDINRCYFSVKEIESFIKNKKRRENKIFKNLCHLLNIRNKEKSFHPSGEQKILFLDRSIFSLIRVAPNKKERILILINVSGDLKKIKIRENQLKIGFKKEVLELVSKKRLKLKNNQLCIWLNPFQVSWIKY